MKPLRFHRAAQAELLAAAEYYAGIHPALGVRFFEAMDELLREIREQPTLYPVFESPVRRHFGRRFPYAVLYIDRSDAVWVVAVMHFKRRPGYWARRLS